MSHMALDMTLKRMKVEGVTVHGFRSSFRDWAGECTPFPREIAEAALAHVVGDQTERAYRRGDALEKRRKLMDAWAGFLASIDAGNVVRCGRRMMEVRQSRRGGARQRAGRKPILDLPDRCWVGQRCEELKREEERKKRKKNLVARLERGQVLENYRVIRACCRLTMPPSPSF